MSDDAALARLARAHGVVTSYRDMQGIERVASPDTLRTLLAANGIAAANAGQVRDGLAVQRAEKNARLFPKEVVVKGRSKSELIDGCMDSWRILSEDMETVLGSGAAPDGIVLPELEPGVYTLEVGRAAERERIRVIAAPDCAPSVQKRAGMPRIWGINLALYGLQSGRNAGLGDYTDLANAARATGQLGADFLGINPLHALGQSVEAFSPYSPSHRGFLNTGHIAPDSIPGLEGSPVVADILAAEEKTMARLRASSHVDYEGHNAVHQRLLASLHKAFCDHATTDARQALADFVAARGNDLAEFARFEALIDEYGSDRHIWPEQTTDERVEVRAEFHQWLQWVADHQLERAQHAAVESGMALGLYLDLAVGARRNGAEAWCNRDIIAQGVSVGAPPDHLSPEGQNWNLAAYAPNRLAEQNYRPFRRLLAAVMHHAGVVRIDHVLGLARSFWIPDDGSPGGYMRQPFDTLLALVKIEAEHHQTVVIGEDLGLVPPGFRKTMRDNGIYGYSVMQYERDKAQKLKPSKRTPRQVLSCFATHDTPTVKGFEKGRDIDWWAKLGWIDENEKAHAKRQRAQDVTDIFTQCPGEDFATCVHSLLARSPAALATVQLDDILDYEDAQNLPGTINEHQNWKRKYDIAPDALATDHRLQALGHVMNENRGKISHSAPRR